MMGRCGSSIWEFHARSAALQLNSRECLGDTKARVALGLHLGLHLGSRLVPASMVL